MKWAASKSRTPWFELEDTIKQYIKIFELLKLEIEKFKALPHAE
jgi:hypothetical protein